MKKAIFFIIFFISITIVADEEFLYKNGSFQNGTITYIFGDNVRVRKNPEIKNNVTDTLSIGSEVEIIKKGKEQIIGSINQNWYHISYWLGGEEKLGYVWGGLLALTYVEKDECLFLVGLKEYKNGLPYGECRLIKDKEFISKTEIKLFPQSSDSFNESVYGYNAMSVILSNKGLKSINQIIKISFIYTDGVWSQIDIYLGQVENKMIRLLNAEYYNEQNFYSYSEKLVFPSDKGGIKNIIQKKILVREYNEITHKHKVLKVKTERYKLLNDKIKEIKGM